MPFFFSKKPASVAQDTGSYGDEPRSDAFEVELLGHLDTLYAVSCRMTKSTTEAEDLVQDTVVKAMRARDQFTPGTNLKAWLLRILTNTFINRYRRGGLERDLFEGPEADTLTDGWVGATTMRAMRDPETQALTPLVEAEDPARPRRPPRRVPPPRRRPLRHRGALLYKGDRRRHGLPDRNRHVAPPPRPPHAPEDAARPRGRHGDRPRIGAPRHRRRSRQGQGVPRRPRRLSPPQAGGHNGHREPQGDRRLRPVLRLGRAVTSTARLDPGHAVEMGSPRGGLWHLRRARGAHRRRAVQPQARRSRRTATPRRSRPAAARPSITSASAPLLPQLLRPTTPSSRTAAPTLLRPASITSSSASATRWGWRPRPAWSSPWASRASRPARCLSETCTPAPPPPMPRARARATPPPPG